MSNVWIAKDGRYLIINETVTDTGKHVVATYTPDLNQASVLSDLPHEFRDLAGYVMPLPAYAVRTVFIGSPPAVPTPPPALGLGAAKALREALGELVEHSHPLCHCGGADIKGLNKKHRFAAMAALVAIEKFDRGEL